MRSLLIAVLCLLGGCAATTGPAPRELPEAETTELRMVVSPAGLPLNVSIQEFEVEAPRGSSLYSSLVQVRSVERRYLPFRLKETLDRSGFWGAVRVMPGTDPNAEIKLSGGILASDGVELKIWIKAVDSTGRAWIDKDYHDVATDIDYATDPDYRIDPFQDMYNRIANDLAEGLSTMDESAFEHLSNVTLINYGRELSPETFDRYITMTDGLLQLQGMPARDDPLLENVLKIRESEYLFADSVDAHYESLQSKLGSTYAWWRHYSFELISGNRRLETVDATRGATRGSWYAMERIYKTYKESKMNEDALRELTASFDRETKPIVAQMAGRVIRLSGTLQRQYEQWRDLLRERYREETGN